MERETVTIETPVEKKKVILNTYLTGREYEYVQEPLMQAMSVRPRGSEVQLGDLNVGKVQESTHRLLEKYVLSVDGKTDKAVDRVLDMRQSDYQFILNKVNELAKKN